MTLKKGDIVLVEFPFTDLSQMKLRPALVLCAISNPDEVTVCFISSQNVSRLSNEEFALNVEDIEFSATGLRVSSKVRVTRIATLQRRLIIRRLGELGNLYIQQLNAYMFEALQIGRSR
ncbi:type II toxin-antitoxin system PemK/MazF family toxin [Microcoleus sp. B5-D4]|uniref:type II toxin-antitoxin system PemK/MazF family toxin n=1 Tax=unclassified Microcoleus TaxID=2642155 RepID=UPI002FCF6894